MMLAPVSLNSPPGWRIGLIATVGGWRSITLTKLKGAALTTPLSDTVMT